MPSVTTATGQSMGAMLSLAMNTAHPGFFTASYYYCVIKVSRSRKGNREADEEVSVRCGFESWQWRRDYAARLERAAPRGWKWAGSGAARNPSLPARAEGEKRLRSATRKP